MEKAWSRCRGGGADNKKMTFIFQNEPFLLLTGYLEFHFRSQGKSGKSQGILDGVREKEEKKKKREINKRTQNKKERKIISVTL